VLLVAASVVPLAHACAAGSTGDTFFAGFVFVLGIAGVVVWLLFAAGLREAGRFRAHRRAWLRGGIPLAAWLASVPVASAAEDWSRERSLARMEEIGNAVAAYRASSGRLPTDLDEVRRATGRDLPEPSWGRGFGWHALEDAVRVRVWKLLMIDRHGWEWDTKTHEWAHWTDD
jgi:hypothetical protein